MATKLTSEEAAAKKAAEEKEAAEKQLTELTTAVKAQSAENEKLLRGMQALAGVVKSQKDVVERMQTSFEESATNQGKQNSGSGASDQDVEALSRKEFLQDVILPQFSSMLDDKLKGVSDRLEHVSSEFETKSVRDEVSTVRESRADFDSWKEEVARELKSNPNLSIEDAYLLAKTRDPEKVTKIDAEIVKKKEDAERSSAAKGSVFGGMRPSGGGEVEKRDDMNQEEAADTAWQEVEEALGGKAEMNKALGMESL